jgi:hypothetical protein
MLAQLLIKDGDTKRGWLQNQLPNYGKVIEASAAACVRVAKGRCIQLAAIAA